MKTTSLPASFASTFGYLMFFLRDNGFNIYYANKDHGIIKACMENELLAKFKSIDVEITTLKRQITRLNFWVQTLVSPDYTVNKTGAELIVQNKHQRACRNLEEKLFSAIQVGMRYPKHI